MALNMVKLLVNMQTEGEWIVQGIGVGVGLSQYVNNNFWGKNA